VLRGCEGIKPGWVRVNFNYFLSETQFQYLLDAIHLVADEGWKLLPHYVFQPETGMWTHRRGRPGVAMSLRDVSYRSGKMEYRSRQVTEPEEALPGYLDEARRIIAEVAASPAIGAAADDPPLTADFEELRWFSLPSEVLAELQGKGPCGLPSSGRKGFRPRT
jgi:hypothetical protein